MNIYVYDDFLTEARYKKVLNRIEIRITDLGLNGRIIRLGVMKNVEAAVHRELVQGAKAIVAVGDDLTVNKVLNAVANFDQTQAPGEPVPIFIIPIKGRANSIARHLGIPDEEEAGEVLSARLIEKVNLGIANDRYFLSGLNTLCGQASLEIDENFSLEISSPSEIAIVNWPGQKNSAYLTRSEKNDHKLELIITPKTRWSFASSEKNPQVSVFTFQKLLIRQADADFLTDYTYSLKTPIQISMADKSIPVIAGKNRLFNSNPA